MLFRQILTQAAAFVLTAGGIGLLAHVLGEALPRRWFHADRFPYRAYAFERGGACYESLGVKTWKDRLPDKSRFAPGTYKKSMAARHDAAHVLRLLQETCVAECVHWALLAVSPVLLLTMRGAASIVMTVLYGLSNLPFIIIQRYNRPRLAALYTRLAAKESGAAA